jgi:hypothetical protein
MDTARIFEGMPQQSLNPGVHFEVGDVNRLPVFEVDSADTISATIDRAFDEHESSRETSVEFVGPGPSNWRATQAWAQRAVDRCQGELLPAFEPTPDRPDPQSTISFAIGIFLGRFASAHGRVPRDAASSGPPSGTLFVSVDGGDSVDSAEGGIDDAWREHASSLGGGEGIGAYLRRSFFDSHKKVYENRPIYLPVSSKKKSFVAFISIHRWTDTTLPDLLAEHLKPTLNRLIGEQKDIRDARGAARDAKAEKRLAELGNLIEELADLVEKVTKIAYEGPPPVDASTTARECDAPFVMDLDDGVMVNGAALWPLLEPQWKDPKKWWKELANAQGKKDYDWSHLAARYFPKRVRAKCVTDPSLAVAHKCFWELHPARAYAWELRLQDEIRPDFTIDEPGSDAARARFHADHEYQAADIRAAEAKRRARKAAKADDAAADGPLFEGEADTDEEHASD